MSDKEPRRRKKRKDSHSRKDDIRADDQIFMTSKSDNKDSDQEAEEEIAVPTFQPSSFAKFVFVILFSGLVLSMSFIFISLRGADRGAIGIFDDHLEDHHTEELDISHDDDDHHHDEAEEWSLTEGIQESIQDILPGIGSILSFNDEHVEVTDSVSTEETLFDASTKDGDDQTSEMPVESSIEYDTSTMLSNTEEVEDTSQPVEDTITPEIYFESTSENLNINQEQSSEDIYQESEYSARDQETESIQRQQEYETVTEDNSQNNIDQSDFTTQSPFSTPEAESTYYSVLYDEDSTPSSSEVTLDESELDEDPFTEPVPEVKEEETFPFYEKADITNEEDYKIRSELEELEAALEKSPERALTKSEDLLKLHKESPRLHYVKAQALDKLAEIQRNNKHLEDAITTYQKIMSLKGAPEQLYLLAGKRAADRMRFRGFMGKSVKLLIEMMNKFPQNVELKNLVAVGYLMIGQNKEAKKILYEVLKVAPDSGFAKVHLGFILKTDDSNYKESITLLSEGIASREAGVIDGRFYFHLGDALHRVGKQEESMKVYEDAVKEGLFLSAYQRSLYNVDGLTGKPWWNPYSTKYAPDFKLLEKNWISIRDEALSITNERGSGFLPETEGLQEKGDWKQLELFARGRKVEKNCLKVPKTCTLISQMPDAATCKRGQVKFSIMKPSTHVWAHTGPTNCRLRAHLGLVVPEGASIRVANETRMWKEGKVILFDDSFEHEVWHNGNASRLVLIVDFWHPELTAYHKRTLTPI